MENWKNAVLSTPLTWHYKAALLVYKTHSNEDCCQQYSRYLRLAAFVAKKEKERKKKYKDKNITKYMIHNLKRTHKSQIWV